MTYTKDQTVYLTDGREAIYVMQNGDAHLVRVIKEAEDDETGPYRWPDEKITQAHQVHLTPPIDVYDKNIMERKEVLAALNSEIAAKRNEAATILSNKAAMEREAAKYPSIQQALDFIEGRITHVVQWQEYRAATILPLKDAFEDVERWGGRATYDGMKLLCLFGTDKHGKRCEWKVNQYRDGSGSLWINSHPARSEEDARMFVADLFSQAIAAWRETGKSHGVLDITATIKENPWLDVPADWSAHVAQSRAEANAKRIAELRAKIAEIEASA